MATVRIYKVAELLNTSSQEVIALLKRDHGIEVKSASSTIEEVVARQFVERLARQRNISVPSNASFADTPAPAEGPQARRQGARAGEDRSGAAAAASGQERQAARHRRPWRLRPWRLRRRPRPKRCCCRRRRRLRRSFPNRCPCQLRRPRRRSPMPSPSPSRSRSRRLRSSNPSGSRNQNLGRLQRNSRPRRAHRWRPWPRSRRRRHLRLRPSRKQCPRHPLLPARQSRGRE